LIDFERTIFWLTAASHAALRSSLKPGYGWILFASSFPAILLTEIGCISYPSRKCRNLFDVGIDFLKESNATGHITALIAAISSRPVRFSKL
jgi:hypothetical protein